MTTLPFAIHPLHTVDLHHQGDCSILGILADGALYAEEIYGDDCWMAQHFVDSSGVIQSSVDEADGHDAPITPLAIPDSAVKPARVWHTMNLNFAGPRHRGLRGPEHLDALVKTIPIAEKPALIQLLGLSVPPPMLLGMAESYVLSEAQVIAPDWFIVCRRIRFAYALPTEQIDADGMPYDYDTRVLYAAHVYHRGDEEESFLAGLTDSPFAPDLIRPMDCAIVGDRLYIGNGGSMESGVPSRIHIWSLERPEPPSPDEAWLKKLYG
ncbi:MAG: hypothetical protein U0670_04430 [Anaerolineae bacterium]